ncbi:PIN domain-containing protein [Aquabacterium sp. A3]|uniref:PIN domain-containing protein n=1 Tax=Aquabacterium sp. A3 TaxID=3132829 RepID=UPI003119BE89
MKDFPYFTTIGLSSWIVGKALKHVFWDKEPSAAERQTSEGSGWGPGTTPGHEGSAAADESGESTLVAAPLAQRSSAADLLAAPAKSYPAEDRASRHDRRLCVFDTNAILNNPHCIYEYGTSDICIPATLLNELDKIKTRSDERIKFMARRAIDLFHQLRQVKHPDDPLGHPTFKMTSSASPPVIYFPRRSPTHYAQCLDPRKADDQIAMTAILAKSERKEVLFISGDKALLTRVADLVETSYVPPKEAKGFVSVAPRKYPGASLPQYLEVIAAEVEFLDSLLRSLGGRSELEPYVFETMLGAARRGNVFAQKIVGGLYYQGRGTPKSRADACKWFASAAHLGDDEALWVLHDMALAGPGLQDADGSI